ncbi:GDSL-type esterase/lipase family protein [Aliifodinibius sp. S!AR15-10]|uniref:SGNH/GDSL hydrolase family protein n=1 Tax=Aliifodinibius sp. S!AR15-10 TaxID=2950437 RepID=UPI0028645386|nr:GDSL-type esterase/lipase family protein [Aliifodinibius sp. S!AR15-10]MDR8393322.1 GDSL-type esterase/lipase family protein [Aliifodinibius sp. S!AR15-10]
MSNAKASKKEKEVLETYLLQFLNLEKRYPLLPGIRNTKAMAGLLGLDEQELKENRTKFDQNAKEAALELLEEEKVAQWIDELPFDSDDTIVAIGDSTTDDLQSWFSILGYALEISVPEADFTFVNSGVSYDTSTDALRRLDRDLAAHEPDWVIVSLGTFDAARMNLTPDRTLVPLAEYWENTNAIEDVTAELTDNPVIWISPPPVMSEMLEDFRLFNFNIQNEDLLKYREILSGKKGYIVDPRGMRMGEDEPEAWNYLNDGLHPSLSGHTNTVRELLKVLAKSEGVEGASFEAPDDFDLNDQ